MEITLERGRGDAYQCYNEKNGRRKVWVARVWVKRRRVFSLNREYGIMETNQSYHSKNLRILILVSTQPPPWIDSHSCSTVNEESRDQGNTLSHIHIIHAKYPWRPMPKTKDKEVKVPSIINGESSPFLHRRNV